MKKVLFGIFASILATACSMEMDELNLGSCSVKISIDEQSKGMTSGELLNSSVIKFYKSDFTGMVRQYNYAELPETIYLPVEEYRVDVYAGESVKALPELASWDKKSYYGSSTFSITSGGVTGVQVMAGIANAISKVTFDSSIAENFSNYYFTIGIDSSDATKQLKYTSDKSGAQGYFIPSGFEPSFYWSFWGTLKKDGTAVVKSGEIEKIEKGKCYEMAPKYTIHDGDLVLSLMVDYTTDIIEDVVIFEAASTGLYASEKAEIWAGHATIHADVDESEYSDPSKIKFSYAQTGTSSWKTGDFTRVSEGSYKGVMTGLKGATSYTYKLVINGEEVGDALSLTTEEAAQLPNNGFETTSNADSKDWISFYNPSSSDPALQTKYWDNGSSASAGMMGASYAICYSDTDVPSGIGSTKSARLQSIYAVIKLAAGNLFVGEFAGLDGTNGKVNFGRPFTARPTGVRFWYKYNGGKVDYAPSGSPISEGSYDIASVQFAIGTWSHKTYGGTKTCPVQVNTGNKSTFWKYESLPETIAYCKLEKTGTGSSTGWQQAVLKFDYKSENSYPTHIIVSAASSKYGDYFAGCSSSALWLDNIELIYE